jgi:glycerol dehydrogenase-like iron-containing ADH family enzyme
LFANKVFEQKTGMGPAHAIAHFLQTKHRKKARHGTLFLTDTTNGTAS